MLDGARVPTSYLLSDPQIFLNFKASTKIASSRSFREDIKFVGDQVRNRDNSIFDEEQLMRCFIAALLWNDGHASKSDYYSNRQPYRPTRLLRSKLNRAAFSRAKNFTRF